MIRFFSKFWYRIPPNALWLYAGSLVAGVFSYLYNIVMARPAFLGPTHFGALAALGSLLYLEGIVASTVVTVTANYTATFLEGGTKGNVKALVRRLSLSVLSGSVLIGLLLVGAAHGITRLLHLPSSMPVFILVPLLMMTLLVSVLLGVLQGSRAFGALSLVTVVGAVLRFLLALPLVAYWHLGLDGALLANLGALIVVYGGAFAVSRGYWYGKHSVISAQHTFSWNEVWKYSGYVFTVMFGLTALFSIDVILAQHYLTAQQASVYASFSTLGRILYFGTLSITTVMFPILTQRLAARQSYGRMLLLTGGSIALICLCFVMLYAALPTMIIRYTVGSIYALEAADLWIYAIFYTAISVATWIAHVLLAQRRFVIAFLPVLCAVVQTVLTIRFHDSAHTIILNSVVAAVLLVVSLGAVSMSSQPRRY